MSIPAALIDSARATPIERVIDQRGIKLRGRVERVGPCPICGGTDRFAINVQKQIFNCRGCDRGGDVIALVQHLDGCNFRTACATLTGAGAQQLQPQVSNSVVHDRARDRVDDDARHRRQFAIELWERAEPVIATPGEIYLRERGIARPYPATVRYLPPFQEHHPALIVPFGLPDEPQPGELKISKAAIIAVQLTRLKTDGSGKAAIKPNKITIASPADLPMVLAPVNDLLGLAICEGVEDALSAHKATGLGAWASGGASRMPALASVVPDYVEAVTIFDHPEPAGERHAQELAGALVEHGIEVRMIAGK